MWPDRYVTRYLCPKSETSLYTQYVYLQNRISQSCTSNPHFHFISRDLVKSVYILEMQWWLHMFTRVCMHVCMYVCMYVCRPVVHHCLWRFRHYRYDLDIGKQNKNQGLKSWSFPDKKIASEGTKASGWIISLPYICRCIGLIRW